MKIVREGCAIGLLALALFAPTLGAERLRAQQPPPGFPDLVGALKATPGCVGVEVARTGSGKQVIFAWFEDKKAALNWYYSDTHQAVMKRFFPQAVAVKRTPLANVPDDGPVLAIASLTMADKAASEVTTLPVSQIAIELYAPLPGGIALGGRFAPSAIKVPGLREAALTAPPKGGQ